MTDSDEKLQQRYRDLAREEPPRALDDAILAASRRSLTKTSLARRWAAPVSIAAVLVLAFGVTLEMQHEEPGIEYTEPLKRATPPPPTLPAEARAPAAPSPAQKPQVALRKASPQMAVRPAAQEPQPFPESFSANVAPQAPAPAAVQPVPAAPADKPQGAIMPPVPAASASVAARASMAAPRAKAEMADAAQTPARTLAAPSETERELERIARLREAGRHEEADKALDDFKRKYPDFRIPEAMWSRVKPR